MKNDIINGYWVLSPILLPLFIVVIIFLVWREPKTNETVCYQAKCHHQREDELRTICFPSGYTVDSQYVLGKCSDSATVYYWEDERWHDKRAGWSLF